MLPEITHNATIFVVYNALAGVYSELMPSVRWRMQSGSYSWYHRHCNNDPVSVRVISSSLTQSKESNHLPQVHSTGFRLFCRWRHFP